MKFFKIFLKNIHGDRAEIMKAQLLTIINFFTGVFTKQWFLLFLAYLGVVINGYSQATITFQNNSSSLVLINDQNGDVVTAPTTASSGIKIQLYYQPNTGGSAPSALGINTGLGYAQWVPIGSLANIAPLAGRFSQIETTGTDVVPGFPVWLQAVAWNGNAANLSSAYSGASTYLGYSTVWTQSTGNANLPVSTSGLFPGLTLFPIYPNSPPIISQQPSSQIGFEGATAFFSVYAAPPNPEEEMTIEYQWRFNGTNLPGANQSTLTFTNLDVSQGGIYDVVVSLEGYSSVNVTSAPATLQVQFILAEIGGTAAISNFITTSPAQLMLLGGYSEGLIFFTLDGSPATTSSSLYTGPITLTNSVTLNTVSISSDFASTTSGAPVQIEVLPAYNVQTTVIGNGSISLNPGSGAYPSNLTVTVTANPSEYWVFDHWFGSLSGNGNPASLVVNETEYVTAVFTQNAYPITISTVGGGSLLANGQAITPATYYQVGSIVTLLATTNAGCIFLGWQGDVNSTNNPLFLTVSQTNNIEAIFGTVVATNTAGGGSILLSQTNPIPFGSLLTLSAIPNSGKYFSAWSGAVSGTNAPTTLTISNPNPAVGALFSTLPNGKLSLSVAVAGNGYVNINPQQNYYNYGDVVTISAGTTFPLTSFNGWTQNATGNNNPLTVVVTSNLVVQANFGITPNVGISPSNLVILGSTSGTLTAITTLTPPLNYQWQDSTGTINGATNASFTIYNAQASNSDNYFVVISNSFAALTSAVANVNVVFPPSIAVQPVGHIIPAGSMASLSVSVFGTAPLSFQWFNSLGAISNATNASLVFNSVQTNKWDNYVVVAYNAYGAATSSVATLVVYGPSVILSQPTNQSVANGTSVLFNVNATGFPSPTYQWSFNGTNLAGATSNTFAINQARLANAGNYQVIINNGYSSATSSVATLEISPSIVSSFNGAATIWGKSAELAVGAVGSGVLIYQWYQNGIALAGATNATLDFESVQLTNAGLYSVVISSPYGSITNGAAQVIVNPAGLSLGFSPVLTITGAVGYSYIIQSSTNLMNTDSWTTVTNFTLTQPIQIWVDTSVDATSPFNSQYFYRVLPGQN